MKLIHGNGTMLEVRDVGEVLIRLRQREGGAPIKVHGYRLLDDDAARALVREQLDTRLYDRDVLP